MMTAITHFQTAIDALKAALVIAGQIGDDEKETVILHLINDCIKLRNFYISAAVPSQQENEKDIPSRTVDIPRTQKIKYNPTL